MRNQIGLLLMIAFVLSSCGKQNKASHNPPEELAVSRTGIDPAPEAQAAPAISNSFSKTASVSAAPNASTDVAHVVIKKSALNKEFLLLTSRVLLLPAPQFNAQESLIVSFIKRENKIFMLNATRTQQVGQNRDDLPLAEFEIISENSEHFEIDFNGGMKQQFVGTKTVSLDDIQTPAGQWVAQIQLSYLDEVKFENESMFVRQKAQLRDENVVFPVEFRYLLKPYQPDPLYVPYVSNDDKKVGYFKNSTPTVQSGEEVTYANRWNPSKKIQFAISANTPVEMRESIRNGLLYWNRVLGAGKIEVIQLEDASIRAPQFNLNIVQWVDWDNLGTAYADMHTDPRTGEILSANIFIPSGKPPVKDSRVVLFNLGLKGFAPSATSDVKEPTEPDNVLFAQQTQKMALRYLFVTVAHECGHTLGFRHNFAGSLAANFDYKDRKSIVLNYVRNQSVPANFIISSSVMDYFQTEDKSLLAETILTQQTALPYDAMAANHLYRGQPLPATRPVYCTDEDTEEFADCQRFDSGRSVVSFASGRYREQINEIAHIIYNRYFPLNRSVDNPSSVREVSFNLNRMGQYFSKPFEMLTRTLKSPSLIAVRGPHMPVLSTQGGIIWEEEQNYLKAEFTRLGGLPKLLEPVAPSLSAAIEQEFQTLMNDASAASTTISAEDREFVLDQVKVLARQIRSKLTVNQIRALSGYDPADPQNQNVWGESGLTASMPTLLSAYFNIYVFSKAEATVAAELTFLDGTKNTVQLPDYNFPEAARLAAAEIFNGKGDSVSWAYAEKLKAIQAMETEIALLGDQAKIDMTKLPEIAANWLLTNRTILSKLKASVPLSQERNN